MRPSSEPHSNASSTRIWIQDKSRRPWLSVETDNEEQGLGAQIVLKACEAPLRTMARNAGESEDIIIEKVRSGQGDEGYDFLNRCMVSTFSKGIIDPKKVTRCALENAASAAGTLLTTSHAIVKV